MSLTGRKVLTAEEVRASEANRAAFAEALRETDEFKAKLADEKEAHALTRSQLRSVVEICTEPGIECRVCGHRVCVVGCRILAAKKHLEKAGGGR
jgi:hypothetical protein